MKYLLIAIPFILFSCANRNNITTHLLNEKKLIEDSIGRCRLKESLYSRRAKEEIHAGADSLVWAATADSSGIFYKKGFELKQKLKEIEFSLDSLSRMK